MRTTALYLFIFSCLALVACSSPPEFDLIIRDGLIIDGSGSPGVEGDVAIRGGLIAEVSDLDGRTAEKIIDARGRVVAPGFIDMMGEAAFLFCGIR